MDFLTIENPHTGVIVNILVITDHFTQYAKAVITPTQTEKATVIAFLKFITNCSFPKKLLTDQDQNFGVPVDQRIVQTAQHPKGANNTISPRDKWPM